MQTCERVIEIRYYIDVLGHSFAQYRMRGGNSLTWIPMGRYIAQQAIAEGKFHGIPVERVADAAQEQRA